MNRRLLWKLCLVIVTGIVAMFYLIDYYVSRTEENMSSLKQEHRDELKRWGKKAERLYYFGKAGELDEWLRQLQLKEETRAAVIKYHFERIAGNQLEESRYTGYNLGRDVDWQIHLWFKNNPIMELPFDGNKASFLIILPDRMRPGDYWQTVRFFLQVFLPMILLALLSFFIYRHIMQPLGKLERATRDFSRGDFSVRVGELSGGRKDELSQLATTFDKMAMKIGDQIVSQRQLISDLSHELRTPLTRLDIALNNIKNDSDDNNLARVNRESCYIRKLVEDTLALAWLENEQPSLHEESLDLVDLVDAIIDDANFEFPSHTIDVDMPSSALLTNSSHRSVGQAFENILRNALRFTPEEKAIEIELKQDLANYFLMVKDQGPGVPSEFLKTIFKPFFRVDKSRSESSNSFGLGLALAYRQIHAVGGAVEAYNRDTGGLCMLITLPK